MTYKHVTCKLNHTDYKLKWVDNVHNRQNDSKWIKRNFPLDKRLIEEDEKSND